MTTSSARNRPDLSWQIASISAANFSPLKVMHWNSRRSGFAGAIDFVGATGRAIILSSLLCSLVRHDTILFRTTSYVSSCVRWSFWPRAKRTHFKLRNPNFELQKIRQESAFDRLKPFSCVQQDISKQTGQKIFSLHRHFKHFPNSILNLLTYFSCRMSSTTTTSYQVSLEAVSLNIIQTL